MNPFFDGRAQSPAQTQSGRQPLAEGPDVRPEEGVDRVNDAVVRPEPAVRYMHQALARPEGVHHVRARAGHFFDGKIWGKCERRLLFALKQLVN